ncbi:MAG: sigma-70 family RNA polymerase sigma factor [Alphaproteobacteria bacterium]|nr:sigma-70 family RNA polymerase sigma factor [Alphaproteobacteria bacterium]
MPTYDHIASTYGPAIERLARGYELDPERRRELVQDVHVALWRSLGSFDGRCSERTWVYRVAHNVGCSHVRTAKRAVAEVTLEEHGTTASFEAELARRQGVQRALALVHALRPLDRQIVLSWLDGLEVAEIADVTGLSAANVSTRLYRAKALLRRRGGEG